MALFANPGDLLTARMTFTNVATATAYNVMHYRVGSITGSAPGMNTFLAVCADAVNAGFKFVWRPAANANVSMVATRMWNVFPLPRSVGVEVVNSPSAPGEVSGEAMPLQDSITILKRTAVGARWGMGRLFFVGLSEGDQANGIISNNMRDRMNNVATWLGSAVAVTGSGWSAVLNPVLVRGPEDNPVSITNVLSANVSDNVIKTQRRRRPGKGI